MLRRPTSMLLIVLCAGVLLLPGCVTYRTIRWAREEVLVLGVGTTGLLEGVVVLDVQGVAGREDGLYGVGVDPKRYASTRIDATEEFRAKALNFDDYAPWWWNRHVHDPFQPMPTRIQLLSTEETAAVSRSAFVEPGERKIAAHVTNATDGMSLVEFFVKDPAGDNWLYCGRADIGLGTKSKWRWV